MKIYILHTVLFFCLTQWLHSQENGVVAFNIPVRNSLKFNKHIINPAFSFVREQNKYISITNKRQWIQFDNAPQTYLLSYSGRFRENIGAGISLFQQDYGVLTTFGGVLNFAYNIGVDRFSNLTFGMNVGFYQSGLNDGKVITNLADPSLENFPSNSLLTINPGINYGTEFFDFGFSINNLVSYNFETSKMIEENPEQGIQAHIIYTGYMNSRGFFNESKFSGLVRSEFKKDKTVVSGIAMLTVPKGIWAQAGYNSLYGVSGGIGLNITAQVAIEYNYEKAMGDISTFGSSHELTLAYKFVNRDSYSYSGDDDEEALLISANKSKRSSSKRKTSSKSKTNTTVKTKVDETEKIKLAAEAKIIADEAAKLRLEEDTRIKLEAEALAIEEAKQKAEALAVEESRLQAESERIRLEEEAKVIAVEEERIKLEEEAKVKAAEEEQIRLEEEAKVIAAEQERFRLEEEAKVIAAEEERIRLEEEAKVKANAAEEDEDFEAGMVYLDEVIFPIANDDMALTLNSLTKLTIEDKIAQQRLLLKLEEKIASKQQDLDDLKEENDLSDQGIFTAPKPFKSVTAENEIIESLKLDLDNLLESQNLKIAELENLSNDRLKAVPNKNEEANKFYQAKISELKTEQLKVLQAKEGLVSSLEDIEVATDFERKRRIKRALYDNEEARYTKDRATLDQIKKFTPVSSAELSEEDLDFGEELSSNIQIVKNVNNAESGFYLVIAVHEDVEKRDDFLTKVVSTGQTDVDFFYDVNTSKYYIYYKKFDTIENANNAFVSKGNEAYNNKMSVIKIEN